MRQDDFQHRGIPGSGPGPQRSSGTAVQQMKPHTAEVGAEDVPTDAACPCRCQRVIKDRDLIVPAAAVSNGSMVTLICNSCI